MGIGKRIEEECKKRGVNLRKLSMNSGVPYSTIYSAVNRDSNGVDADAVKKIADVLGISAMELYPRNGQSNGADEEYTRIEEVKSPTMTVPQACKILRCEGYSISNNRMMAGIYQGVYPFGEVVDRMEGLMKTDKYTVYTALLKKWIEERRVG